jgi:hypothetical protein
LSGLTKIFVVLQLVFSLILSVLLVFYVSKADPYKKVADDAVAGRTGLLATIAHLTQENEALNAAVADKENKLAQAVASGQRTANDLTAKLAAAEQRGAVAATELAKASTQVTSQTAANELLSKLVSQKDAQIGDLSPKVSNLIRENAELTRANNELQTQQRGADQAIRKLQEQVATLQQSGPKQGATGGTNDGGAQVTSLSAQTAAGTAINGKVTGTTVSAGRTLVATGLGSRDGIKVNTRFAIYRGNSYVADAVVERVTPDESVAVVVTPMKSGDSVKSGDVVRSGE